MIFDRYECVYPESREYKHLRMDNLSPSRLALTEREEGNGSEIEDRSGKLVRIKLPREKKETTCQSMKGKTPQNSLITASVELSKCIMYRLYMFAATSFF